MRSLLHGFLSTKIIICSKFGSDYTDDYTEARNFGDVDDYTEARDFGDDDYEARDFGDVYDFGDDDYTF